MSQKTASEEKETAEEILRYYSRKDIREAMLTTAENREIGVRFGDGGFGKRPDILSYPRDVLEFAKQGVMSFHCSEERWSNPLQLSTNMSRSQIENLRIGWDLIIDVDCDVFEFSKICADLVVKAIKYHNIESVSVKFSGNHGFHIAIPFEAFPRKVVDKETKNLFPEGANAIANYLKEMIRKRLYDELRHRYSPEKIAELSGKETKEITNVMENARLFENPYAVLSIDIVLISNRHLFRMPYSINEKSGLASIPTNPDEILKFDRGTAEIGKVKISDFKFLNVDKIRENEANELFIQAFDFNSRNEISEVNTRSLHIGGKKEKKKFEIGEAINEEFFPPCIKLGLQGLEDGKKRFLFVLLNFLTSAGWKYEEIGKCVSEWNKKNSPPLRDNYVTGQLRYHKNSGKKILPPNCRSYYEDLRICYPDAVCAKIKNPVNYAVLKSKSGKKLKKT
ncbi:MAG TPA: DNA primase small subunit domain-containing protein [Candidatus Nanoarchaeia archaeon]|nr:DNA primase small subunit domain-containing protein [Candidatus Nanoarchaeia archaeon]